LEEETHAWWPKTAAMPIIFTHHSKVANINTFQRQARPCYQKSAIYMADQIHM
jgi:hypothetical protein